MKKTCVVVLIVLALLLASCATNPNDETELTTVNKEELSLSQNGVKIYGNLYRLADMGESARCPLVIMSHSANVNSDTLDTYAKRSAGLGYVVYTFDYPGASSSSRSDSVDCTIFTETETLRFVIDYFSEQAFVDGIFLFGTSQGGLISAIVADEKAEDLRGLILFYPAFNIPELMVKYSFGIDENYKKQLEEYDVFEHIGTFSKDVLIVHGTQDIMVPYSYSERAAELYVSCNLQLIEGANHGFNKENYAFNNNYDDVTWQFVETYLNNHKTLQ
ncbi:MAG: alpha/beta hydrolase family protein [Candidatus Fimimonas sp.]